MKNTWQTELDSFYEDCKHAIPISHKNLQKLMKDNQNTEYGTKYHFSEITNIHTYQNQVPISDYSDYQPYIERMVQGEEQLLTAYEVKHYIHTSGSTGLQKKIPLTQEALNRCVNPIYYASYGDISGIEMGKYLHMSVFRMELPKAETETILSAAYYRELHDRGTYHLEERYLGGEALMFTTGIGNIPYVKAWIALSSPEIAAMHRINLCNIRQIQK
uniref:GH3 family domain-containing protein n=1 Tax=Agathobacter sp. TaxID=2021311 RepID=UPI0040579EDA